MSALEVLVIAVGLALDATAVSICAGSAGFMSRPRSVLRLSFHFGLFQAVMPLAGWLLGRGVAGWMTAVDHWIAFGLLAFIGIRMVRSGLSPDGVVSCDPSRGSSLIMLSVATSIDAFAVGLSLALLDVSILYPCIVIGVVTMALSIAGAGLGHRLRAGIGPRMEIVGGLLLIGIGLRILIDHLGDGG